MSPLCRRILVKRFHREKFFSPLRSFAVSHDLFFLRGKLIMEKFRMILAKGIGPVLQLVHCTAYGMLSFWHSDADTVAWAYRLLFTEKVLHAAVKVFYEKKEA